MKKVNWLIRLAFSSLKQRKSRTLLVILSLTLASALTTALYSFSLGARLGLGKELRAYGANLVISSLTQEAGASGLPFGQATEKNFFERNNLERFLLTRPEVKDLNFQLITEGIYQNQAVPLVGVEDKAASRIMNFWRIEGFWPRKKGEVLAGRRLAEKIGLKKGQLWKLKIGIKQIEFKVAGLVESGGAEDSSVVLSLAELESLADLKGKASYALVRVEPPAKAKDLKAQAEKEFPGVEVKTLEQAIKREEYLVIKVEHLLFLATAFVLLATSISVSTTTSTTVLERWKEVGLLKSLGASNWLVAGVFILESLVVSLLAGLAGFLGGWFLTQLFSRSVFALWVPFIWWTLPAAFLTCLLIVTLSFFWPLRLIVKIEPALVLKGV